MKSVDSLRLQEIPRYVICNILEGVVCFASPLLHICPFPLLGYVNQEWMPFFFYVLHWQLVYTFDVKSLHTKIHFSYCHCSDYQNYIFLEVFASSRLRNIQFSTFYHSFWRHFWLRPCKLHLVGFLSMLVTLIIFRHTDSPNT